MSDDIDRAQETEEFMRKMALLKQPEPKITATGFCLFCAEKLMLPRRWCDAECRDEWQLEQDLT